MPKICVDDFQKNVTKSMFRTNLASQPLFVNFSKMCVEGLVRDYDMVGRAVIATSEGGEVWKLDDIRRRSRDQPVPILPRNQYPDLPCDMLDHPTGSPSTNLRAKHWSRQSDKLIYNRVPKCASTTILIILTILGEKNHFAFKSSLTYWVKIWSKVEEQQFADFVRQGFDVGNSSSREAAAIFDQHFYFVDVERYGVHRKMVPNWMNVVRDPVERIISQFNYMRRPDRWPTDGERPPKSWFDKDFSTCVLDGDVECQYSDLGYLVEQQLTYFCGNALECSQVGNAGGLMVAKTNVERHFSVVGIASDLKMSLRVMEGTLPRFFAGATDAFQRLSSSSELAKEYRMNKAHNEKRVNVSDAAIAVLRRNLSMEIDFYQFAVQRLMQQDRWLRKIGI